MSEIVADTAQIPGLEDQLDALGYNGTFPFAEGR